MYHLSLFDTLIHRIKIICLVHFTVWHVNTSTTDDIHILSILSKIYDYVGKGKHFFLSLKFHMYIIENNRYGVFIYNIISVHTQQKKNRKQLNRECIMLFTSKLQWGFQLGPNCFHHKVSSIEGMVDDPSVFLFDMICFIYLNIIRKKPK